LCRQRTQDTEAQQGAQGENHRHSGAAAQTREKTKDTPFQQNEQHIWERTMDTLLAIGQDDYNIQTKYTPDEGRGTVGAAESTSIPI
jgi:hypothetical protein